MVTTSPQKQRAIPSGAPTRRMVDFFFRAAFGRRLRPFSTGTMTRTEIEVAICASLRRTARWRQSVAKRFPSEPRNLAAVERLGELTRNVALTAEQWAALVIHATGYKDRLSRNLSTRSGSNAYAFAELLAQLGSAFLCAHSGIPARDRSAFYVENWLKMLKEDRRAIFQAASDGSQAAESGMKQSPRSSRKRLVRSLSARWTTRLPTSVRPP